MWKVGFQKLRGVCLSHEGWSFVTRLKLADTECKTVTTADTLMKGQLQILCGKDSEDYINSDDKNSGDYWYSDDKQWRQLILWWQDSVLRWRHRGDNWYSDDKTVETTDPDHFVVQTAGTLAARHAPHSVTILTTRAADRTWRHVQTRVAGGNGVGVGLGSGDDRGNLGHCNRWKLTSLRRPDTQYCQTPSLAKCFF